MKAISIKPDRLEIIVLIIMLTFIVYQVLCYPVVGLANNGDFWRFMLPEGLEYITTDDDEKYFKYINIKFSIIDNPKEIINFFSSEVVFVKVALVLNRLISKDGLFDLRLIGLVHAIAFLLVTWIVLISTRDMKKNIRYCLVVLIIFIFSDVAYVSYFNSLYCEPASLIYLFAIVGLVILISKYREFNFWLLLCYFVACLLFTSAKAQNAVFGIFLALFMVLMIKFMVCNKWQIRLSIVFAILLFLFSCWVYSYTPKFMKEANIYSAVFYEILRNSPNPELDLIDLGIDKKFVSLAGTNAFSPNAPILEDNFKEYFFTKIGYGNIGKFYLSNPDRLLDLLNRGATYAFYLRPIHLGNFDKSVGLPPTAKSQAFSEWSFLKAHFPFKKLWFIITFMSLEVIIALIIYLRLNKMHLKILPVSYIFLIFMTLTQFIIVLIGEGELDIIKHLFLFNTMSDLCLIINVVYIINYLNINIGYLQNRRRLSSCS